MTDHQQNTVNKVCRALWRSTDKGKFGWQIEIHHILSVCTDIELLEQIADFIRTHNTSADHVSYTMTLAENRYNNYLAKMKQDLETARAE